MKSKRGDAGSEGEGQNAGGVRAPIPVLLDWPDQIRARISEAMPELRPALERIVQALASFVGYLHGTQSSPRAISTVLTQAANDFVSVLYDISCGRGRTAIMSCRSLFELVVTAKDFKAHPNLEERYRAHKAVVHQIESRLRIETNELAGKERRADVRRREKLAQDSQEDHALAVTKYGRSFAVRWAPEDLLTRAKRHGMEQDYDFYRVASAVLHGSAGGSLGLIEEVQGALVHRQGAPLYLCPLAFLEGVRLFSELVRTLGGDLAGPSYDDMREALKAARSLYPQYRRIISKLDRLLWPEDPPPRPIALLGFIPLTNVERWFIWDPLTSLICPAESPEEVPEATRVNIEAVKRAVRKKLPTSTEWFSIGVEDVKLSPQRDARWQPAGTVLEHPLLRWNAWSPESPREVEVGVELELDDEGNLRPER